MSWQTVLTGTEGERARAVALDIASRLAARERAAPEPSAAGLGSADASIALVCGQLDRWQPGADWDRAGHVHLSEAARAAERDGAPLGLFDGIAGLGFAAQWLAGGRARYGTMLTAIDDALAGGVAASHLVLARAHGLPVRAWDLISGITGIGAYLLARGGEPALRAALQDTLAALVDLMRQTDGTPRWATPSEHLHEGMRAGAPDGNLNCGVAHGAPGSLALMSLALAEGVEVPGQVDTIRRLADWVADQRRPGLFGPEWPAALPLGETAGASRQPAAPPGWCYGNAGVGRALWLAGHALDEPDLVRLAHQALRAALDRQRTERPLQAPTVCHGTAGLTHITLRMAADTGTDDLERDARMLCLELLERVDFETEFGYRAEERLRELRGPDLDATLLDGAAGTALVLLAAATDVDPGWDRVLLLS
jgi:class I lanthipeptide synthase